MPGKCRRHDLYQFAYFQVATANGNCKYHLHYIELLYLVGLCHEVANLESLNEPILLVMPKNRTVCYNC